ncbi:MAG: HPF/RaiA family ribosome-associated protein [Bacteroidota bacterium]
MIIQVNTDNNVKGSEGLKSHFTSIISEELSRFSKHITRIEVHLSDENSHKESLNDKRCMLEARIEGKQPIAVTNHANNHDQSLSGAIDKLKASLDTIFGRLTDH